MTPFLILLTATAVFRCIGAAGVKQLQTVSGCAAPGLAVMFAFTGATHFTAMKHDYAAMIPPPLPNGLWVIYVNGALELAGAIGLVFPRFRALAAAGLAILLVAMTPGNIYAALNEIPFRGQPPTAPSIRLPIQVVFIGLSGWVAWRSWIGRQQHSRRRSSSAEEK